MSHLEHSPYPLEWPIGRPRTPAHHRRNSLFKELRLGRARKMLLEELRKLEAEHVVVSTDLPVRLDGLFYANSPPPPDPGVAVYFHRKGRAYCIACDMYPRLVENVRALESTLYCLRKMERHGASGLMEQALSGFKQLTGAIAIRPKWWEVFDLPIEPSSPNPGVLATLEQKYKQLIREHHPDRGGEPGRMALINDAMAEARRVLSP